MLSWDEEKVLNSVCLKTGLAVKRLTGLQPSAIPNRDMVLGLAVLVLAAIYAYLVYAQA